MKMSTAFLPEVESCGVGTCTRVISEAASTKPISSLPPSSAGVAQNRETRGWRFLQFRFDELLRFKPGLAFPPAKDRPFGCVVQHRHSELPVSLVNNLIPVLKFP